MTAESSFLISLGQTLATMALYGEGHPARERALDASFELLLSLTENRPCVEYSFLGGEAVTADRAMPELGSWDWAQRFSAARIERIEIDADVTREAYLRFVDDLFRQLSGRCVDTAEARQLVRPPIRFGLLRLRRSGSYSARARGEGGASGEADGGSDGGDVLDGVDVNMGDETAAIQWIHDVVQQRGEIPLGEVEAVVHSLAATIHAEERMLLPLLTLKEYDQYTTTHACNVAVLAMALAERLGLSPSEVRAIGVAGLLHDIGKVRIPHELLVKPGRYSDAERKVIQRHPVDGARIILERERGMGLAAVVAYEHHIFLNGEGYPSLTFPRACHFASRIVHVCDIYDALCTNRPYRQAWAPEQTLAYIVEQSGRELDPQVVDAFVAMISEAMVQRIPVAENDVPPPAAELPSALPVAPARTPAST